MKMNDTFQNETLKKWGEVISEFHLPRWDQLPDLELYMDQVIQLVDQYLSPVTTGDKHPLLTKSMVNNYVKLGLIPPPVKKRYTRTHVAFLLAITTLKQVLTIPEIKEAIVFQGRTDGIREAYNFFCREQESALHLIARQAQGEGITYPNEPIPFAYLAARTATIAFANKILAAKVISCEIDYLRQGENND
ncbi:DUF1836 domain-containing protein [Enterococcus sp. MJM12]|uniref:DUF1836 domain-containing protein n=1 Tax=Candidatus Enterococcus myersii TaxID=2815322 RepID=A0ABS3H5T0_9ENTE|nr:DUF1836 domain-containing protein [Enterococcus sp. MJM12]MBO0448260.1 DUF1836 domain-containing protein [Enterococcus sp. MJM12]